MNEIVIIGGGMIGLTSAYFAARSGYKVTLIEAKEKVGGLLSTFETGGAPLECFYHHFFTHDREIQWFINELGLSEQLFFKETRMGIFRNKNIYNFTAPTDLFYFQPLKNIDKFRFALTSLFLSYFGNWQRYEKVSAYDWFYQWAGPQVTASIWKPMLDVKFGNSSQEIPLSWMIGRLSQRVKSRKGGVEKLGYLKGSLRILVEAIKDCLIKNNAEIICNDAVTRIVTVDEKVTELNLRSGRKIKGNRFLCTVAPMFLSPLLSDRWNSYKKALDKIEYLEVMIAVIILKKRLSDIYWLNVADKGFPFGGVIEHTNFISSSEYNGKHIVYLSRYFKKEDFLLNSSFENIAKEWIEYLLLIYPKCNREDIIDIKVFHEKAAAPLCKKSFSEQVPTVKSPIKDFYVVNMTHIYPDERSVNNSIRVAANACNSLGIDTKEVPRGVSLAGTVGF